MNDVKSNLTSVRIEGQSYGISFVDTINSLTRPSGASNGNIKEKK